MGAKNKILDALSATGAFRLARLLPNQNLVILNYHRIVDRRHTTLFDDGVFGPDVGEFDAQIRWLKKNTDVLSESELLEVCDGKRKWRGTCSAVTFDDAYLDCYSLAYPALKAAGVPAIFFVPTGAVTDGRLSWWDRIAFLVKTSRKPTFVFRGREFPAGAKSNETVGELLLSWRSGGAEATRRFIEELAVATGSSMPTAEDERGQVMSWDQIREVAAGGIGIGSHTEKHHILSHLPPEDQRRELTNSKATIEKELGRQIVSLAYPVGQYEHFTDATKKLAEECGYRMAFSFLTGTAVRDRLDRFDIQRTVVPETMARLDFGCAFPQFFFSRARVAGHAHGAL